MEVVVVVGGVREGMGVREECIWTETGSHGYPL